MGHRRSLVVEIDSCINDGQHSQGPFLFFYKGIQLEDPRIHHDYQVRPSSTRYQQADHMEDFGVDHEGLCLGDSVYSSWLAAV